LEVDLDWVTPFAEQRQQRVPATATCPGDVVHASI